MRRAETWRVAIQRDAVEGSRPTETTHLIAREAGTRGHEVWCYTPADLRLEDGRVMAWARRIHYAVDSLGWSLDRGEDLDLSTMDVVLTRNDPPVDMAWLSATWLLDLLPATTLVLNPPHALRDVQDKLVPLALSHRSPPTLITADPARIAIFRAVHGDIVVKPLYEAAGVGIFFFDREDPNFDVVMESWLPAQRAPVVVQRYQPEAREGTVRIIVVDGQPCSAMRSVPLDGVRRTSMDRSSRVEPVSLTAEQEACVAEVSALLVARGVLLAAIDLVGPWLLEVNVTSPGGGIYFDRLFDDALAPRVWDAIERRRRPVVEVDRDRPAAMPLQLQAAP